MKVKLVLMKLMTMHWGIIIIIIELWHHHYCTSSPSSSLHCGIKLTLELVRDLRLHLLLSGRCSLQLHSVCNILYFVLQVLLFFTFCFWYFRWSRDLHIPLYLWVMLKNNVTFLNRRSYLPTNSDHTKTSTQIQIHKYAKHPNTQIHK